MSLFFNQVEADQNQNINGRIVVGMNDDDSVYDSVLTGGISPLSRSLGLVSDNLQTATVSYFRILFHSKRIRLHKYQFVHSSID